MRPVTKGMEADVAASYLHPLLYCMPVAVDPDVHLFKEVPIRTFGVGLIAIATFAAAGFLLSRRRLIPAARSAGRQRRRLDRLYAAGM